MNKKFFGGIFLERENLRANGIYYPIKVDYYKIENYIEDKNEKIYGIEVVKTEYKENDTKIEVSKLNEISNKEEKIDKILNIFKNNKVTPIIAEDVARDLMYAINE
jgi:hypothetical protein